MKNIIRIWFEQTWPKERKHLRRIRINNYFWGFWEEHGAKVLISAMILALMLFVIYGLYWNFLFLNVKNNGTPDWISFIGSYWGGILGGIVSGVLSIGGTWLIIRFTRKTDYHRQRIENLPLISLEMIRNIGKAKMDLIDQPFELVTEDYIYICIENVGTGVAVNIRFSTGEDWNDTVFATMFEPKKKMNIKKSWAGKYYDNEGHKSNDEMGTELLYEDIFGNEYSQVFCIYRNDKCKHIPYDSYATAEMPELKKPTRRKQYVQ